MDDGGSRRPQISITYAEESGDLSHVCVSTCETTVIG